LNHQQMSEPNVGGEQRRRNVQRLTIAGFGRRGVAAHLVKKPDDERAPGALRIRLELALHAALSQVVAAVEQLDLGKEKVRAGGERVEQEGMTADVSRLINEARQEQRVRQIDLAGCLVH
jgi:hypothetical protein